MSHAVDPLKALRQRFLARCAEDLAILQRAAAGEAHPSLKVVVHRLSGTAGTFGFWEISQAASPIDDVLHEGGAPSPDQLEALASAVKAAL